MRCPCCAEEQSQPRSAFFVGLFWSASAARRMHTHLRAHWLSQNSNTWNCLPIHTAVEDPHPRTLTGEQEEKKSDWEVATEHQSFPLLESAGAGGRIWVAIRAHPPPLFLSTSVIFNAYSRSLPPFHSLSLPLSCTHSQLTDGERTHKLRSRWHAFSQATHMRAHIHMLYMKCVCSCGWCDWGQVSLQCFNCITNNEKKKWVVWSDWPADGPCGGYSLVRITDDGKRTGTVSE